jgi:protein-disulfide isomerase
VSAWVPRVLIAVLTVAIGYAIYSIAVGEGGPQGASVGGVNDVQRIFGGIEQQGAYLGPEDAEVTVSVFNDLQSTTGAQWEIEVIDPLVESYARGGDVRFDFRHFSIAPNDTTLAAIASEAAGLQDYQWQYLDTFARNQRLANGNVDDSVVREVAQAMPTAFDIERWQADFESPRSEDLVRQDAILGAELELPAEPAVVVSGPGGQRELIERPSLEQIEDAIAAVG